MFSNMEKADVVIVGGGIAGLSTAASLCAESNLKVILVEKAAIGSNQSIRAVFKEAVEEFGLQESVLQHYTGFIFHSPLGSIAKYDYRTTALMGIDYEHSCRLLAERACRNGLQILPNQASTWSPQQPSSRESLIVHLENGDSIQTKILVDASGVAQWAARRLNIKLSPLYSICYGELLKGCREEDVEYFRFLAPNSIYGNGGGWMYPSGAGRISLGYSVVVPHPNIDSTNLVSGYTSAKREFHPYAEWVAQGVRERIEGGVVPVGRIGQFVTDRIIIVGDAAGQAHPWSVEGCRPCLINGKLAAEVILEAFRRNRYDRKTLASFERKWAVTNRERFWRSKSVSNIMWHRSNEDWEQFIAETKKQSPEVQLQVLRDNQANLFQAVYAVGGYARRQTMIWCRNRIKHIRNDSTCIV